MLQRFELGVAPDHACRHAFDAAGNVSERAWLCSGDEVALDRLVKTLDCERRLDLYVEEAAHEHVGVMADAQMARGGRLLHAGSDIDGAAANRALGVDAAAEQYVARVNAHAHVETSMTEGRLHFGAENLAECEHRKTTSNGALGIILSRLVGAERSQDAVARVLQDLAAVFLDERSEAGQRPVQHFADRLGVQTLTQRG